MQFSVALGSFVLGIASLGFNPYVAVETHLIKLPLEKCRLIDGLASTIGRII